MERHSMFMSQSAYILLRWLLIYKFYTILIKIPASFFVERTIWYYIHVELLETKNSQNNLEQQQQQKDSHFWFQNWLPSCIDQNSVVEA